MDFLDPKAKRRHSIRLGIGYALMGILIAIATTILVFQAYGFDVDRKTGEVIQNGLVFVDSAPDGANVLFNGETQKDKTNNRFALPSGDYNLKINKDGYREWQRNFKLDGGEVERFTYPMLIPSKIERIEVQTIDAVPAFVSESPDRRWVIASQGKSLQNFTEYDLNTLNNEDKPASRSFALPGNVFTAAPGEHKLELVEWSNDNKHLLIKHSFSGRYEFVVISRDQPQTSININSLTSQNPTKVILKDKEFDKWYFYAEAGGILQAVDAKKTVTPLLTGVTSFKTHDDDTILYSQATKDGKSQRINLLQGNQSYVVRDVANGAVMLDIARFNNAWYVVIGSDADKRTYIYRNPQTVLSKRDDTKPVPRSILKTSGAMTQVSFSQNARFIMTQSGQHFEVFDAEYNQIFRYDLPNPIDPSEKVVWMDGHRLLARSQNNIVMFDFDGSNRIDNIATQLPGIPVIFDRDYTVLYNLEANLAGKTVFYSNQLRLEGDK